MGCLKTLYTKGSVHGYIQYGIINQNSTSSQTSIFIPR